MSNGLISREYKKLQRQLHQDRPDYGAFSGSKWAETVLQLAYMSGSQGSILDYGCGKQSLQEALPQVKITGYDPGIEGLDADPEPHEMVVCTDVLEHIEPELLDNVLDHLRSKTKRIAFLVIDKGPAKKVLADGRNAHLIQEDIEWWLPKLWARFNIDAVQNTPGQLIVTCSVREVQ